MLRLYEEQVADERIHPSRRTIEKKRTRDECELRSTQESELVG